MKIFCIFILVITLNACVKEVDNFLPDGSTNEEIIELKVFETLKGDPDKMRIYTNDKPRKTLDSMKKNNINHFTDSVTCNTYIQYEDTQLTMTGFDFSNYILVPVFITSSFSVSNYNIYPTFQVKCMLNTNLKTATIVVRSKYSIDKDRNSSASPVYIKYQKWLSVPKLPKSYRLIVPEYVDMDY